MERTEWNDGVEVTQAQLRNEHDALAGNILQRWKDAMDLGVRTGLTVTVNGTNATLVDLAAGLGYSPNGELCELTAPSTGLALSSYLAGVDNYVCLVYTEVSSRPEAHETDGTTRTTKASRSVRVRVFTLAELGALAASTSDLSLDAQDRVLVCGVVNANGVNVALTTNDITTTPALTRILSIDQPSVMTGVEVITLDAQTPTTAERIAAGDTTVVASAQLRMTITFVHPSPPSSITLEYKAPGDSTFGAPVVINAGGSPFTLTSSGGRTIQVGVGGNSLPVSGFSSSPATITETLTVSDFYTETVGRTGARDELHRRDLGAVIPARANPHGLKSKNLGGVSQELLGTTYLGGGLESTFAQTLIPRLWTNVPNIVDGGQFTERTYLWQIVLSNSGLSPPLVVRFYGTTSSTLGFSGLEISVNARWAHNASGGTKNWVADSALLPAVLFSVGANAGPDSAVSVFSRVSTASPWTDLDWVGTFITSAVLNRTMFNGFVDLGRGNLGTTAGIHTPRVEAFFSTTAGMKYTLLWRSAPFGGGNQTLRVYASQVTSGEQGLYFTWNARWDQTLFASAGGWVADNASFASAQFGFVNRTDQTSYIRHLHKVAGAGSWTEFDWTTSAQTQGGLATAVQAVGNVNIGNLGGAFSYTTPRTYYHHVAGGDGQVFPTGSADINWGQTALVRSPGALGVNLGWAAQLPAGATITQIDVLFSGHIRTAGSMVVALVVQSMNPGPVPVATVLASETISASLGNPGYLFLTSLALPHVVSGPDEVFNISVDDSGDFTYNLHEFRITYTLPYVSHG